MIIKGSIDNKIVHYPLSAAHKIIKGHPTFSIVGGEFAIVDDRHGVAFQTLLGSCVAVMFFDRVLKIKAINHFLLPQSSSQMDSYRFGLFSIEEMLNSMYKLGVKKKNLVAKIAGGAKVLDGDLSDIGYKNVAFAREFCATENISILSQSVLGSNGRIVLLGSEFETFIRYIDNRNISEKLKQEEKELEIGMKKANYSKITLF